MLAISEMLLLGVVTVTGLVLKRNYTKNVKPLQDQLKR